MLVKTDLLPDRANLSYDLCIVGAGPVGIAIASRLRSSGLRLCLVESGGFLPSLRKQSLNRGENLGHEYWPLQNARYRIFGGSGSRWGGMSRPLDDCDFDARDWVADSGWPIKAAELSAYYPDTARVLGLDHDRFDIGAWNGALPKPMPLRTGAFMPGLFQYSPTAMSFGEHYRADIENAPDIDLLLDANVIDCDLDESGARLAGVTVALDGNRRISIRARATVLACGGIENARILLAARSVRPAGLGNENDLVGRYFQEHVQALVAHMVPSVNARDRRFFDVAERDGHTVRGVLIGTPEAQRNHELLACSIAIEPPTFRYGQPLLNWPAALTAPPERVYRRLRAHRPPQARADGEGARVLARKIWYQANSVEARRAARVARARAGEQGIDASSIYSLYVRGEQVPNRDSRVRLGTKRDRFGTPEVQLRWKLTDQDHQSLIGWLDLFRDAAQRNDLGQVIMPPDGWTKAIHGGPHHMGTTRMSASPRDGVVDPDGQVHSVSGLYVTGTSVFTTGGHANPTFTAIALGLRLADHLRTTLC